MYKKILKKMLNLLSISFIIILLIGLSCSFENNSDIHENPLLKQNDSN